MIKDTLRSIGLTGNEVEIYLALIISGELSVSEIGSKAGLHRQVCYDALDRLVEKGFVAAVEKDGKLHYRSLKPDQLSNYLESKQKEVKAILPELNSLFVEDTESTHVEIVKGKNVMRTVYNDIKKTLKRRGQKLYAMGIDENKFLKFDRIAIKQYVAWLKRNNRKEYLLSKESATTFFEGEQSVYKLLPDHLFNPNPTHIYGDKVAMIVWGYPTYGIIIQSKELADANRKYFEILWKTASTRKIAKKPKRRKKKAIKRT